jgi:cysteine-rich repeat protein
MKPFKVAFLRAAAAAAILISATPSHAFFHLSVIDEIQTSLGGDSAQQFVEIQMLSASQNLVANSVLASFDTSGNYIADVLVIPSNVASSGAGDRWIMATTAFQTANSFTADFTIPATLPVSGGMLCWGAPGFIPPADPASWSRTVFSNYIDCVAYGNYSGPTNVHIGTPIAQTPVGHSLQRGSETNNNSVDFICSNIITPQKNGSSAVNIPATTPCSSCGDTFVDAGEQCDDGNTVTETCAYGQTSCLPVCDATCHLVAGAISFCGDGSIRGAEACDDGNGASGDGCSASCLVESGYACTGQPSVCTLSQQRAQTKDRQACINEVNLRGAAVAKEQGTLDLACLTDAGNGKVEKLGTPPQTQSAQACLGNDVKFKVAAKVTTLGLKEATKCLALPSQQLPDYAYTGATATAAGARSASVGLTADLFGPDLGVAVVPYATDKLGAACQREVQKRSQAVFDQLWTQARTAKKTALKGKTTAPAVPPVADIVALQNAILTSVEDDLKQTVAKKKATLIQNTIDKCTGRPLATLFPGACATSANNPGALAVCADESARCRFCESLNVMDAMTLDCDEFDNALADDSCL